MEYPTSSDFQPLKPLQVSSFTPSYTQDYFINTAWTLNGKIQDLNFVYTGSYLDRHIKEQMEYTNYSRSAGGMYYQCVGGSTGWGSSNPAVTAPYCYSPKGYWDDSVRNTHLTQEVRVSTPDDWRLRAIAGAFWEDFQIDDVMNFKYKTIPCLQRQRLSRRCCQSRRDLRRRCRDPARDDGQRTRHPRRQFTGIRRGYAARLPAGGVFRLVRLRHHPESVDGHRRHALVPIFGIRSRAPSIRPAPAVSTTTPI